MQVRVLSGSEVAAAVPMAEAIDVMRDAFTALSSGDAVVPLRVPLESAGGVHLFMPGLVRSSQIVGAKVVSVNPGNAERSLPAIHALVLLLDAGTGRPTAIMDGTRLTAMRTGAAGGLAADVLARPGASVVALFGAGVQARTQLEAVRCVRPITEVRVVSRTGASARRLAAEVEGVRIAVVDDPAAALAGAEIVIAATDSERPVFDGRDVEPGTHVTGVGSYTPAMREVDTELVRRAYVVVDQREAALEEAGDLAGPIADGAVSEDVVAAELGEVVSGARPGRTSDAQITFFKSVGSAVQDITLATRVLEATAAKDVGRLVEL